MVEYTLTNCPIFWDHFNGPQAAIGTVITIPVVILGVLIQKHLITGFSFGTIRK
jgi:ABC-type glycerol-3-phosphate transport system permease component